MSVIYHIAPGGQREGPLTHLQVHHRIDAGELGSDCLAWHQDLDSWQPLGELKEFEDVLQRAHAGSEGPELASAEKSFDARTPPPYPDSRSSDEQNQENQDSASLAPDPLAGAAEISSDDPPQPFRIWTRIAARIVDSILLGTAACILFSLAGGVLITGLGMFFPLVLIASTFLMEAGLLCSFGTTPGKALLGITVRSAKGEILTWGEALRRSLLVWLRGLGLGYPLFALILGTFSYLEVRRRGTVLWDREQRLRVTYSNPLPSSLAITAAIVLGFFAIVAQSGVIGHTIHFMQTGEVPEGLELPEGFELPNRPSPREPTDRSLEGPTA